MVDPQAVASKKRTLTYMHANELTGRLTSKADFIKYLDNHCKFNQLSSLISFQYSTTFQTKTLLTKTSSRTSYLARSNS